MLGFRSQVEKCVVTAGLKRKADKRPGLQQLLGHTRVVAHHTARGDAFGTRIVLQEVGEICAVDFDPVFVKDVHQRMEDKWKFECKVHDMLAGPVEGKFDAAYSLDVIEHIGVEDEDKFVANVARSLSDDGVLIVGTPSLQSQTYASRPSKEGHINCKDQAELKTLLLRYFKNVFVFSMNDEVVHTGFYPMAHYLFALCTGRRSH